MNSPQFCRKFRISLFSAQTSPCYRPRAMFARDGKGVRNAGRVQTQAIPNEIAGLRAALERLAGPPPAELRSNAAECFWVWGTGAAISAAVLPAPKSPSNLEPESCGIDHVRDILARQHGAVRQGIRGQQCPPLGCAGHGQVVAGEGGARRGRGARRPARLILIEISREDIGTLQALMQLHRQ